MTTLYIIISIISGIFFGVIDGLINANPLAARLNALESSILGLVVFSHWVERQ